MGRFTVLCLALTIGGSAAAMAADPPSSLGQPIREGSNAAQNATNVTAALKSAGFTDVGNTSCSGRYCSSVASWEGKPMRLTVELRTGRVEAAGGSAAAVIGDPANSLGRSIRKGSNAAQNATNVTAALQEAGYTNVRNTSCSGAYCSSVATWNDKSMNLRIELRNGRIEAADGSEAVVPGGPPNKLVQTVRKGSNAAQHATNVTAALQQVGYTEVKDANCSGDICTAQALWEDKPMKLRVELRTRRIEAVAQ